MHLIKPYGFDISSKNLRRAGLDYLDLANVTEYDSFDSCYKSLARTRIFAATTKSTSIYTHFSYQENDSFIFGPETRGLPDEILQSNKVKERIRIPMVKNNRSLNLSNSVGIVIYEAWRQLEFENWKLNFRFLALLVVQLILTLHLLLIFSRKEHYLPVE